MVRSCKFTFLFFLPSVEPSEFEKHEERGRSCMLHPVVMITEGKISKKEKDRKVGLGQ